MTPAIIGEVQKDSPAFVSGFKKNDKILFIDNKKVESILEVSTLINTSTSDAIEFIILRNDQELSILVKPNLVDGKDSLGNSVKKKNDRNKSYPFQIINLKDNLLDQAKLYIIL